jgi:hypothetical protein
MSRLNRDKKRAETVDAEYRVVKVEPVVEPPEAPPTIIVRRRSSFADARRFIFYFGIGVGVYWLAWGDPDWSRPTVYLHALFWPFILLWWLIAWAFWVGIGAVILIGGGFLAWKFGEGFLEGLREARAKERARRARED